MQFTGSFKQVTGKPSDDPQIITLTLQVEALITPEQFAEAGALLSKTIAIEIEPLQPSLDLGDVDRKTIVREVR